MRVKQLAKHLVLISAALATTGARAESTLPVGELITPAFKPIPQSQITDRAAHVVAALDRLEARLKTSADPDGWRVHLGCDEIRKQAELGDAADRKKLAAFLPHYFGVQPRCEWPETRDVRTSLVGLITALETAAIPDLENEYTARLGYLQELTERHAESASSVTAIGIGRQLHWLRHAGQADAAVKQIRGAWGQPNFYVQVGLDILTPRELEEMVTEKSSVVDNILGTAIRGQAQTQGKVSMRLVPNAECGMFELELRGQTIANTQGVNGPAKMLTTSQSNFTALTRVRITADGMHYDPPQAHATTHSNTHDLEVPRERFSTFGSGRRNFVERFAWKKVEELKPQADAIASQHSEVRYEKSMGDQVGKLLEKTNKPFQEKVRDPLVRLGALWEYLRFSSTDRAVTLRMLYADGTELGADTKAVEFRSPHSLSVRVHESLLRNAGHMLLRGTTVSDHTLAKFLKGAMGEIPREAREYRLGSHLEPWTMTLADEHPLLVDFDNGTGTIAVRLKRVTIGEQKYPVDLLVRAKYDIAYTQQGPRLTRVGKVQVATDPAQVLQPSTEVLQLVERKASGFFIPEIYFDGLVPPAGGPFDKYAQLTFRELIVRDGWFAMGFDNTAPRTGEQLTRTPAVKAKQR